jgi:hypothetical protein
MMKGNAMERVYLDAVLESKNYTPIFNGVRQATIAFIQARMDDEEVLSARVCVGENLRLYPIDQYLAIYAS